MATTEETIALAQKPDDALQLCAAALTRAGFRNVSANQPAKLLTAQKRAFGQWTKSQVTLVLAPAAHGGTSVTLVGQATAQSLSSLASDPSERLVRSVVEAIDAVI